MAAGGVLSGEHGIGIEKRDLMPLMFAPDDLDAQARLREAFDPDGLANPHKVLPAGSRCGDIQYGARGRVDLRPFAEAVGGQDPVTCVGHRTRWAVGGYAEPGTREVSAPAGIERIEPEEMTVACGAGTPVDELLGALAERGPARRPAAGGHGRRRAGRRTV